MTGYYSFLLNLWGLSDAWSGSGCASIFCQVAWSWTSAGRSVTSHSRRTNVSWSQVAHAYTGEVILSRSQFDPQAASDNDVGWALLYEHNIAQSVNNNIFPVAAPPWLVGIQQQLVHIKRNAACSANTLKQSGLAMPYDIVPFEDGSDPMAPLHNLTPLRRAAHVNALTGPVATLYCQGYGIQPVPNGVVAQQRAIKAHIGCQA